MRRSFISTTEILRLISASRRRAKVNQNNQILNSQGNKKIGNSYLYFENMEFDKTTRVAKIELLWSQDYRTIDRYITQNYVRYPVYSSWKTRQKTIYKSIKLTNQVLENLESYPDEEIQTVADDIVAALNDEELYPSWFIKKYLTKKLQEDFKQILFEEVSFKKKIDDEISVLNQEINSYNTSIALNTPQLEKYNHRESNLAQKLNKLENSKKSILKSIFTLCLYNYFISSRHKEKLSLKIKETQDKISLLEKSNKTFSENISQANNKIEELNKQIGKEVERITEKRKQIQADYDKEFESVEKLPFTYTNISSFIPLKNFIGFEYKKIIGCYAIHNTEKDKYYVGQSKDVFKRLRQHFSGTIPKNIIFAEDYYSSSLNEKENLFEIKIFPCSTKDELDSKEKELIKKYSAHETGYNGTNGNS